MVLGQVGGLQAHPSGSPSLSGVATQQASCSEYTRSSAERGESVDRALDSTAPLAS